MEHFRINRRSTDQNPENPDNQSKPWMFNMQNNEMFNYPDEFKFEKANSFEELQQRLANYNGEEKCDESVRNQVSRRRFESPSCTQQFQDQFSQEIIAPKRNMCLQTMEQLRKWSCRYNGNQDPFPFLERVEELADLCGLDLNSIPRNMVVLLKNDALLWFQNNINIRTWNNWDDFKSDFLRFFSPIRSLDTLEDEIRFRREKHQESFKGYVTGLQNLIPHPINQASEQFQEIGNNWQIDNQRRNCRSLEELISEEHVTLEGKQGKLQQNQNQILESRIENSKLACRKCGTHGHHVSICPNPRLIFCWTCGKVNVRTIDCCKKQSKNDQSSQSVSMKIHEQTREQSNTLGNIKLDATCLASKITTSSQMVKAKFDIGKLSQNQNQISELWIENLEQICRKCGEYGHYISICQNPRLIFCWTCGKVNVRTSDCCNKQTKNVQSSQSLSMKVNEQTRKQSNTLGILKIDDTRVSAKITIGGQMVEATLDTGATRSFISEELASKIDASIHNESPITQVRMTDNGIQCINREICGRIQFESRTVFLKLIILPNIVDDIILGIDFLKAIGTTITIGNFKLDLNNRRKHSDEHSEGLPNSNNIQLFKKPKYNSTNVNSTINKRNNIPLPRTINNATHHPIETQGEIPQSSFNNSSTIPNNMALNNLGIYNLTSLSNLPQLLGAQQFKPAIRRPNIETNATNKNNANSYVNKVHLPPQTKIMKANNLPSANQGEQVPFTPKQKIPEEEWPQELKDEIMETAKTRTDHKPKGFKRSIDGKVYQIRINRSGSVSVKLVLMTEPTESDQQPQAVQ